MSMDGNVVVVVVFAPFGPSVRVGCALFCQSRLAIITPWPPSPFSAVQPQSDGALQSCCVLDREPSLGPAGSRERPPADCKCSAACGAGNDIAVYAPTPHGGFVRRRACSACKQVGTRCGEREPDSRPAANSLLRTAFFSCLGRVFCFLPLPHQTLSGRSMWTQRIRWISRMLALHKHDDLVSQSVMIFTTAMYFSIHHVHRAPK
ncbi:hypothetical protein BD289DRAFT_448897 [Coniella lustricola]|uniref:Uncharacterized protein n=1 Tax=Coniella lustricola TaxID=2025994 RepID=A0A2T2ZRT4_9PEZI|nr:hypothetical protein BD289DRAFT_448897 [Coniella lustricola]